MPADRIKNNIILYKAISTLLLVLTSSCAQNDWDDSLVYSNINAQGGRPLPSTSPDKFYQQALSNYKMTKEPKAMIGQRSLENNEIVAVDISFARGSNEKAAQAGLRNCQGNMQVTTRRSRPNLQTECVVIAKGDTFLIDLNSSLASVTPRGQNFGYDSTYYRQESAQIAQEIAADDASRNQALVNSIGGIGSALQGAQNYRDLAALNRVDQLQRQQAQQQQQAASAYQSAASQQQADYARQQAASRAQDTARQQAALAQQQALLAQQVRPVAVASTPAPAAANGGRGTQAGACLSLVKGSVWTGGISTESATLRNNCSYPINYSYCIISKSSYFSCYGNSFGAGEMRAGGTDAISIASASGSEPNPKIAYVDCVSPSFPVHKMFVGASIRAECQ